MSRVFQCWLPSIVSALAMAALSAFAEQTTLVAETSLRPEPGAAEISAFLTSATPVEVLERNGDWIRVRVEGWVRAQAVSTSATAAAAVPAAPPPPPPAAEPAAAPPPSRATPGPPAAAKPGTGSPPGTLVSVEGLVRVKLGSFNRISAAGIPVLLLPGDADLVAPGTGPDSTARLAEIDVELTRMKQERERAMSQSNFGEAIRLRDEIDEQRDIVLDERLDLLAAEHGRHEQAARAAALATTTADSKGWFGLAPVPPGTYKLYARLTQEDHDVEWIEVVTVGSAPLRVELDETKGHGLQPDSTKLKSE